MSAGVLLEMSAFLGRDGGELFVQRAGIEGWRNAEVESDEQKSDAV